MNCPKIQSVKAIDAYILVIEFDNEQKKAYDIRPLLKKEMFAPLRNEALFKTVQVEQGGYAIIWSNDLDISEHELWRHGQVIS